jgi:hypothetical protein
MRFAERTAACGGFSFSRQPIALDSAANLKMGRDDTSDPRDHGSQTKKDECRKPLSALALQDGIFPPAALIVANPV